MPSPEFFQVLPVAEALKLFDEHWQPTPQTENLLAAAALNRIVASDILSPEQVPSFRKSTMDGYALRARDTFGASQSLPAFLEVIGEVKTGDVPSIPVSQGQAVQIHTGGMLPDSTDAVVMVEYVQAAGEREIEVFKAVAPGENVIQPGEDVAENEVILQRHHQIRSQDIGGLLAVGMTEVEVIRRPRVGILSCGDELVAPEITPPPGKVRDINTYILSALVEQAGGEPIRLGIASDSLDDYRRAANNGFAQSDILLLSAGSSVSARDYTRDVIHHLGQPGVLQHGLATKPGKPTILAVCDNKPVIGLPGNPVSALLVAQQILPDLIARYTGQAVTPPQVIRATLSLRIASVSGREDWVAVRLKHEGDEHPVAEPVFGKSNLIFTLIQAEGLLRIPLNASGLAAGTLIDVILFQHLSQKR